MISEGEPICNMKRLQNASAGFAVGAHAWTHCKSQKDFGVCQITLRLGHAHDCARLINVPARVRTSLSDI